MRYQVDLLRPLGRSFDRLIINPCPKGQGNSGQGNSGQAIQGKPT